MDVDSEAEQPPPPHGSTLAVSLFSCYIVITNVKRGGWIENILLLLDPGSTTISIVPELTFQGVTCLEFTARKWASRLSCHIKGGKCGVPSFLSFPKLVTALYWSTNIHVSTTRWASRPNIFLFLQFISNMFYYDFWWFIRTYGIHCLFYVIFCSLDYYYLHYVYIVIISYSRLYHSFNIPFLSSYYCFLTRSTIFFVIK